jgi:ribonuclease HII
MFVIGIDEVGRGPVVGPVHVGAVILDSLYPEYVENSVKSDSRQKNLSWLREAGLFYKQNKEFCLVRDSKKLTEKERLEVFELINRKKISAKVLMADNDLIDEYGIGVCISHLLVILAEILHHEVVLPRIFRSESTICKVKLIADGKIKLLPKLNPELTKKIAKINNLSLNPSLDFLARITSRDLFSGNSFEYEIHRENGADDKYLSVALASNYAKVTRDNLMHQIHLEFPDYDWERNKGYCTAKHLQAIKQNPVNKYFRKTFLRKILS